MQDVTGIEWVAEIAIGGALVVGLVFVAIPRRFALVLVGARRPSTSSAVLRPVWCGPHGFVSLRQARSSRASGPRATGSTPRCPDDAEVGMVWSGRTDRFTVNQNEFFNRSVGSVY